MALSCVTVLKPGPTVEGPGRGQLTCFIKIQVLGASFLGETAPACVKPFSTVTFGRFKLPGLFPKVGIGCRPLGNKHLCAWLGRLAQALCFLQPDLKGTGEEVSALKNRACQPSPPCRVVRHLPPSGNEAKLLQEGSKPETPKL